MMNGKKSHDIEKYASDLATIKSLLLSVEEKTLIEIWAFLTWGVIILIGTGLHALMRFYYHLDYSDVFYIIWLPLFLIAIFLETAAWIKKISRDSLPFFSRPMIKFWLSALGTMVVTGFVIYVVIKSGSLVYLPAVIMMSFALFLLIYAQMSYIQMYIYGYLLIIFAIIQNIISPNLDIQIILSGIVLGIVFIICRIFLGKKEKIANEKP
jgi:hypothetical protein